MYVRHEEQRRALLEPRRSAHPHPQRGANEVAHSPAVHQAEHAHVAAVQPALETAFLSTFRQPDEAADIAAQQATNYAALHATFKTTNESAHYAANSTTNNEAIEAANKSAFCATNETAIRSSFHAT